MNLKKYQFDNNRSGVSSALFNGCLNKFNNCLSKKYRCSFVSSSEIYTKTFGIFALNFYRQSIDIASSYSIC